MRRGKGDEAGEVRRRGREKRLGKGEEKRQEDEEGQSNHSPPNSILLNAFILFISLFQLV
jgi:hypothetical protein